MLIEHKREKLLNAIIYFVNNTRNCNKVKVIKLLYLLDFRHYQQTGRSVTGLEYQAWANGPVPVDLYEEFRSAYMPNRKPKPDFDQALKVTKVKSGHKYKFQIQPKVAFDDSHLTRREMRIINELVQEYKDHTSSQMIEETHLENKPWDRVYCKGAGQNQVIPYELALRADNKDTMLDIIQEHAEFEEMLNRL